MNYPMKSIYILQLNSKCITDVHSATTATSYGFRQEKEASEDLTVPELHQFSSLDVPFCLYSTCAA